MRNKRLVGALSVALVAIAVTLYAFGTARGDSPTPVSGIVTHLPDGRTEFTLRNHASASVTAYAVNAVFQTRGLHEGWLRDAKTEGEAALIAPGNN